MVHIVRALSMTMHRLGHAEAHGIRSCGLIMPIRALPTPHVSEITFIVWCVGGALLSVAIAQSVSRWWNVLTGPFVLTYVAIAVGMYSLER